MILNSHLNKILILTAFAVGIGSLANAQSATISANAKVISEIAVTSVSNLNFGTLVAGQTKSIDQNGYVTVSSGSALGTANMGEFTVAAQAGSDVSLVFILPTGLTGSNTGLLPISFSWTEDSQGDVLYVPSVRVVENTDGGSGYYDPSSGPIRYTSFPTCEAIAGKNSVRVFIGGRVDSNGVSSDTYTGTITLSATYN